MKVLRQHPAALDPRSSQQACSSIALIENGGQFFVVRYHHDRKATYDHLRCRDLEDAEHSYARRLMFEADEAFSRGWADVPEIPAAETEKPAGLLTNHFLHSFVAHPIMALFHLLGFDRAGNFVHDRLIVEP